MLTVGVLGSTSAPFTILEPGELTGGGTRTFHFHLASPKAVNCTLGTTAMITVMNTSYNAAPVISTTSASGSHAAAMFSDTGKGSDTRGQVQVERESKRESKRDREREREKQNCISLALFLPLRPFLTGPTFQPEGGREQETQRQRR